MFENCVDTEGKVLYTGESERSSMDYNYPTMTSREYEDEARTLVARAKETSSPASILAQAQVYATLALMAAVIEEGGIV